MCEDTATFLHEKQKKMQFYFVIREIMVIFALEIERQLIIELHFLTETWNFNLLLITNKIKTKK
ncbi:hypothetical protein DW079_06790 [Segatella copri]|uniref:Uncharacterized protein n=1 Tax=Segatella copri TaxID=165179 RepID=A0A415F4H8_9BACT|nr:hypothetical protein DW079_06790 [Segatella copri]